MVHKWIHLATEYRVHPGQGTMYEVRSTKLLQLSLLGRALIIASE